MIKKRGSHWNGDSPLRDTLIYSAIQKVKETHNRAFIKPWLSANAIVNCVDEKMDLHLAAWMGDIKFLKMLVRQGQDICRADGYGWTALHLATWNMHTDVALFLMDAATDKLWVSRQNVYGQSALHFAALNEDVELLNALLKAKADTTARDRDGLTAVLCAAKNAHSKALLVLMAAGADMSVPNREGWTPVHWAAENGYVEAIKVLKAVGLDVSAIFNGWAPLHLAAWYGHSGAVTALKEAGANVLVEDKDGLTAMFHAAKHGYLSMVNALIDSGFDVTAQTGAGCLTPMHFAAESGHAEIIDALYNAGGDIMARAGNGFTPMHSAASGVHGDGIIKLKHLGANISVQNSGGGTPLYVACVRGNLAAVKVLLELGSDVHTKINQQSLTVLHGACISESGDEEIVGLLIRYGVDVNATSDFGCTALHFVASKGHKQIVPLLVKGGAIVDVTDRNGSAALHVAANKGNTAVVHELLDNGSNVNLKLINELTRSYPLNMAVFKKFEATAKLLLDKGAEVDSRAYCSKRQIANTALQEAVIDGDVGIVRLLLHHGASPTEQYVTRNTHTTMLHIAAANGYAEIARLLLEKGAKISATSSDRVTALETATRKGQVAVVQVIKDFKKHNMTWYGRRR